MDELAALAIPAAVTLLGIRGDSLQRTFTLKKKGGSAIALTGLSGAAQVRQVPEGPVMATLTVVVDQAAVGQPTTGQVVVTADATVTGSIPREGIWDCQLTDGTVAFVKTVFQGPTDFGPDVTT